MTRKSPQASRPSGVRQTGRWNVEAELARLKDEPYSPEVAANLADRILKASRGHPSGCQCSKCGQDIPLEHLAKLLKEKNIPMIKGQIRPELFLISSETILAMDAEELMATYNDMEELGIAHLPYSCLDIGIPGDFLIGVKEREEPGAWSMRFALPVNNPIAVEDKDEFDIRTRNMHTREILEIYGGAFKDHEVRFRFLNEKPLCGWIKYPSGQWSPMGWWDDDDHGKGKTQAGYALRKILIVLLGTKNIVKTRTKDKLLSMGIGTKKNNHRPLYTTTITLPRPEHMETEGPHIPGLSKRPHLRRGHKRNQKYGPKLQFVKPIWIEPVFINADEDFVSARTAYNTSNRDNNPTESKDERSETTVHQPIVPQRSEGDGKTANDL